MNKHYFIIFLITSLFGQFALAQVNTETKKQLVKGWEVETGYFFNGQPYAKVGKGDKVMVQIEALSWDHKPPEGFLIKLLLKESEAFLDEYTVYRIGRRPNLPTGYTHDKISREYGALIRREFKSKVDVFGLSTGGQIGLCLAANFPELIDKLVIVSAAHQLSDEGKVIERTAVEYFEQKKYGKSMAAIAGVLYEKGIKRLFYKSLLYVMGSGLMKGVEYPNDFRIEVAADCAMDFKGRLKEIKNPTLIVTGKKDIGYSIEDVKVTADGISNSKLLVYDDYGHNLYPDNYAEVNRAIMHFLK